MCNSREGPFPLLEGKSLIPKQTTSSFIMSARIHPHPTRLRGDIAQDRMRPTLRPGHDASLAISRPFQPLPLCSHDGTPN